jgi:hypothetical protein
MKIMQLVFGFGCTLAVSGALAQTSDVAAWRPSGPTIADAPSPIPQFVQQDMSRGGPDRDRLRGGRMNRDDDEDRDAGRGLGMIRHPMAPGMMALGGARFYMRKGDAAIDVRCPSDVRLNDCVDAIGRVLDRLGAMGAGSGGPAATPR